MTPGYRAKKVSFEEEYRKVLYPEQHMKLTKTNEKHLSPIPKTFNDVFPQVDYKADPINDTGLNNVDIDKEMAEMAENSLRYEMSTKLINRRLGGVRKAISGRV
jgi:flagellar basal-body rod protein FlgB